MDFIFYYWIKWEWKDYIWCRPPLLKTPEMWKGSINILIINYWFIIIIFFFYFVYIQHFATLFFIRCWICLWLWLWTTLSIWHETHPFLDLIIWTSLCASGGNMTEQHGKHKQITCNCNYWDASYNKVSNDCYCSYCHAHWGFTRNCCSLTSTIMFPFNFTWFIHLYRCKSVQLKFVC